LNEIQIDEYARRLGEDVHHLWMDIKADAKKEVGK